MDLNIQHHYFEQRQQNLERLIKVLFRKEGLHTKKEFRSGIQSRREDGNAETFYYPMVLLLLVVVVESTTTTRKSTAKRTRDKPAAPPGGDCQTPNLATDSLLRHCYVIILFAPQFECHIGTQHSSPSMQTSLLLC